MADIVRILGLDNNNRSPMFRMETGEIFSTPRELIEFWLTLVMWNIR